jgi:hypothetical protein
LINNHYNRERQNKEMEQKPKQHPHELYKSPNENKNKKENAKKKANNPPTPCVVTIQRLGHVSQKNHQTRGAQNNPPF